RLRRRKKRKAGGVSPRNDGVLSLQRSLHRMEHESGQIRRTRRHRSGVPMILFLKNLLFTLVVPGTVAVYLPLRLVENRPAASGPVSAAGGLVLAAGPASTAGACGTSPRSGGERLRRSTRR